MRGWWKMGEEPGVVCFVDHQVGLVGLVGLAVLHFLLLDSQPPSHSRLVRLQEVVWRRWLELELGCFGARRPCRQLVGRLRHGSLQRVLLSVFHPAQSTEQ